MSIGKKLLKAIRLVDPAEIADLITDLLGNKVKLEIIELIVKEIGYTKLAEIAGSKPGSIASAINRGSIGDDLAFRIFKGLAREKPHLLRFALETVFSKYEDLIDSILEKVRKREEEIIKSATSK